jgi:ketosteroid isomerase-like protein
MKGVPAFGVAEAQGSSSSGCTASRFPCTTLARRGDSVFDQHLVTVLSFRDGKVSAIDTYMSDVETVKAFFV